MIFTAEAKPIRDEPFEKLDDPLATEVLAEELGRRQPVPLPEPPGRN